MPDRNDPHRGQPVLHAGIPVGDARLVAILLHGRGSSATDILGLSRELNAADIACRAPQRRDICGTRTRFSLLSIGTNSA